jgi:hypothetical protein
MPIESDTYVLAIMPDNEALHVGTAEFAAPHVGVNGAASGAQFYDQDGRSLVLLKDRIGGTVFEVNPRGVQVDDEVLLGRINAALAHMQAVANERPEEGEGEVPRPTGSLLTVLTQLSGEFNDLVPTPNRGNWLHGLAHAAGLAH